MRRLPVVLAGLTIVASISGARAVSTPCTFTGPSNSYRVVRFVNPDDDAKIVLGLDGYDVTSPGQVDRDYWAEGIFVVRESDRVPVAFLYRTTAGASGHVRAQDTGGVIVDASVPLQPVPDADATHLQIDPSVPSGTYYIVAFSFGGGSGISIEKRSPRDSTWSAYFDAPGSKSCALLDAPGEMKHYDERNFHGSMTEIPGVRNASDLVMDMSTPRAFLVGTLQHGVDRTVPGEGLASYSDLRIETPSGTGDLPNDVAPISSTAGPYRFTLRQRGVLPVANLNFVTFDLPA